MNPLTQLYREAGQSPWLDNIRRGMIRSGELRRMIADYGLRGVTSNPTIFEKAISGSTDYDEAILECISKQAGVPAEIFESLAIRDIQDTADLFRPVFEESKGGDGHVSIEVSPRLARETQGTLAEARRLFGRIARPNVMVKIPGTVEGLPAVEEAIAGGINVNITLLFSLERYAAVVEAYLKGLERRVKRGEPVSGIASVASFFVSRVDTQIDKALEAAVASARSGKEKAELKDLLGKAAIANAKLAYQIYKSAFSGARFAALRDKGARPQRLLWASTSTKNPAYRDVIYVEELIGPDTVNTMPQATLGAFKDHGRIRPSLEEDVEGARGVLDRLKAAGVDMARVTRDLETEGVKLFADSYDSLLWCITAKREMLRVGAAKSQSVQSGPEGEAVQEALAELEKRRAIQRLWSKDPSLWKDDPSHQKIIRNSLGWLDVVEPMRAQAADLEAFAQKLKEEEFTHSYLLGMGGSSLAPEVVWLVIGAAPAYPKVCILDSTDPARIRAVEKMADAAKPLFYVSSKSGTTIESACLFKYFWERMRERYGEHAGEHFVAITDPGTPLEKQARELGFRRVFLNAPEIGGRFSALSYFGLVPSAVIGLDLQDFLGRALGMVQACQPYTAASDNPGLELGAALAAFASRGRDKITFLISPLLSTFGIWVEQLLAESTGKEGKGLVPVAGEPAGPPEVYRNDRVFVAIHYARSDDTALQKAVSALEGAGHPVIRIFLKELPDIAPEFFRWEVATAVAGVLMGINAFDQPNVQESKDRTGELLATFKKEGRLPEDPPALEEGGLQFHGASAGAGSLEEALANHLSRVRPGDYVALLAYMDPSEANEALLQSARVKIRDRFAAATTLGWGPRFLHSTGQLHKGGADNGVFIQLTVDDEADLPIPGEPYSFGVLKRAQALGDLAALTSRGRRVVRIHLKAPVAQSLRSFLQALDKALTSAKVPAKAS